VTEPRESVPGVVSEVIVIAHPAKVWQPMALRGVLSVAFGVVALFWPGITVLALALLFGAWSLLDGISFLVTAAREGYARAGWRDWLPYLFAGLLGVAAAVATVLWPAITVLALTVLVAVFLIGVGVAEIVLAIRLRRLIRGEIFLILAGIVAVLAGLTILIWPAPAVLVLTWVLGICALVVGILLVVAAVRIRGLARSRRTRFGSGPTVAKAHPHSP
jgi:uncharacterized membrane protein HdeD (DUF308 family)